MLEGAGMPDPARPGARRKQRGHSGDSRPPSWLQVEPGKSIRDRHDGATVLFVCTGNICRSAFARSYLRSRLGGQSRVAVSSAGTHAPVGHSMDAEMAVQARRIGIDADHRARQLNARMLRAADLILVFSPEHVEWIASEDLASINRTVPLGRVAGFLRALPPRTVIPVGSLAQAVEDGISSAVGQDDRDFWISDPHGLGPAAARRAADRICGDIDVLVGRVGWE